MDMEGYGRIQCSNLWLNCYACLLVWVAIKFPLQSEHCFPNLWLVLSRMLIPHAMSLFDRQFPFYCCWKSKTTKRQRKKKMLKVMMERKTKNRKEKGEGCWCIYLEATNNRNGNSNPNIVIMNDVLSVKLIENEMIIVIVIMNDVLSGKLIEIEMITQMMIQ